MTLLSNWFKLYFSKHFSNRKIFKLVRCKELLHDLIDSDIQDKTIRAYHIKSNHKGINETFQHLRRTYYFPHMKTKIRKIINNCEICQILKYERHPPKVKFEVTTKPDLPLDILDIDVYSIQNQNILTIIDRFSKFAVTYILTARNSISIVQSLRDFFTHHGITKKIVCDPGTECNSNLFKEFCDKNEIILHITTPQNSTGNSTVERFHSTLTEIYRIIYDEDKNK